MSGAVTYKSRTAIAGRYGPAFELQCDLLASHQDMASICIRSGCCEFSAYPTSDQMRAMAAEFRRLACALDQAQGVEPEGAAIAARFDAAGAL